MSQLIENYRSVLRAVQEATLAAGRPADAVRLLAVSKTFPAADVEEVFRDGQPCFGENRVQELAEKAKVLPAEIEWHLIGHLQQNKVRAALEIASWIHSVDTPELLHRIETIAAEIGKSPRLFLEVNISGEESKFGMSPETALATAKALPLDSPAPLVGLMTMAPFDAPEEELRKVFGGLRQLRDKIQDARGTALPELSMGMSGDYRVAIQEGATIVRIGTAIFGHRE